MKQVLPAAQSPSILPQKRKFSNEKSKYHDDQFRSQVLEWMALTPEDLDDCDNGVVTKQGVTVTLALWKMEHIYLRRLISKDTSNGSWGDQTPADCEVRIRELERALKAAIYDRQQMIKEHLETIETVKRDFNQMMERLLAMPEEEEASMETIKMIISEIKKLTKAESDHQCKREKSDA
ncbi:hypothetical protein THARTR1_01634 [Trichoderma harzianum]|uniref:Uncharacterized protein n=1 Tax=Trichoderma harzianum TaxID=5544 RepID=A0A2K0ULG4_TRIHA|nr:hypothetical protein THARTR1_01634 [Trichoderma harzianum]